MRKIFIIQNLLILFLFLTFSVGAREISAETITEGEKESSSAGSHGLLGKLPSGSIEYKYFWQFEEADNDDRRHLHEGILKFDIDHDFGEKNSISLTPVFRLDNRHFTAGIIDELKETEERRYHINFKEAYWVRHGTNGDLYLGKRIYNWGKAEGFNPTDNINPYDYLDFPDREKIGVLSAAAEYSVDNYLFDIVFIPLFTPSRLPGENNRWVGGIPESKLPALPVSTLFDMFRQFILSWFGIDINISDYEIKDRELPSDKISNSQYAGRLRTTVTGWDFALSYYHGFDSVPVLERETILLVDHFTPVFNRINKYGFAVATTFNKLELHGETSYRDTEDGDDDDFLAYIIGGSYSWNDLWDEFIEEVNLSLEYAGEKVTHKKDNENRNTSEIYTRPFKRAILGNLIIKFSEDMEVMVKGSYNMDENDSYVQPKLTYKFSDSLKLNAGFDILSGEDDTFWGRWGKNDRFFTFITYYL